MNNSFSRKLSTALAKDTLVYQKAQDSQSFHPKHSSIAGFGYLQKVDHSSPNKR
jgi:hypothetical protein